eukprot:scaffold4586_cov70-Skeletonema_dohrnii-CCMP3373.AAC.2
MRITLLAKPKTRKGDGNGNDAITGSWKQDGRIESNIGLNRWPRRERSSDEILLGKYDEGGEDHVGNILGTRGKSPHILDKGGIQSYIRAKAALINWINLLRHGCKLDALINDGDSPLRYGSEFRGVPELETIFGHHPNWERMKRIILQGSNPILDGLDFDARANDLNEALEYGNHKSARALVAPMGIQRQNTIDEHGKIIQKDRLTHAIKASRSDLAHNELLKSRIFCQKIDFKSAFRRLHLNAEVAIQSCTQLPEEEIALIPLRMTFGGAPNPSEWGVISETSCDLANELLSNDGWNPLQLHSPNQHLVPPRQALSDDIPFAAEGRELIVDVPIDPGRYRSKYISSPPIQVSRQ